MDYITLSLGAVNCFWRQLWDIFKEKRAKGKKSRLKPGCSSGPQSYLLISNLKVCQCCTFKVHFSKMDIVVDLLFLYDNFYDLKGNSNILLHYHFKCKVHHLCCCIVTAELVLFPVKLSLRLQPHL